MNLYQEHASEFSRTRQHFWKGWYELEKYLINATKFLDIGCGNGRFLKFIKKYKIDFNYVGIDYSQQLLQEAGYLDRNAKLFNLDLRSNWDIPESNFDFVVCFGVIHHLLNQKHRKYLFRKVFEKLNYRGVFVFTIWDFLSDLRQINKIIKKIPGKNNFLMKFGNIAVRECHWMQDSEFQVLLKIYKFRIIETYQSDGKNNKLNKYIVTQKCF